MLTVDKHCNTFLYRQVVDLVNESIDSGTLRPGDRLPSLRSMSQSAGVSVPTVRQAYIELERQRRVESRPQSGFYVNALVSQINDIDKAAATPRQAKRVRFGDLQIVPVSDGLVWVRPYYVSIQGTSSSRASTEYRFVIASHNEDSSFAPTLGVCSSGCGGLPT